MIIRTNASGMDHTQNTIPHNNTQQDNKTEKSISGEAQTPMTIDNNDTNDTKLTDIKQKVEDGKYLLDLDSTSQKMAQELLQR